MIDIIVCGAAGRMGQRLVNLTAAAEDLRLVGATEYPGHAALGQDVGVLSGSGELGIRLVDDLASIEGGDVAIAFTTPEATLADAATCAAAGRAMVVGTTGFNDPDLARFKSSVESLSCVFAPNYSTAMNVLFRLVEKAAHILGDDYDVEVVEAHHRLKVDAPSGTALRLAEAAASGLDRNLSDVVVHGREGITGARTSKEIGMHALRLGDVAGTHAVFFGEIGEYLELRHHATSRDAFALGALRAARFAAAASAGLYDMGDVLGL